MHSFVAEPNHGGDRSDHDGEEAGDLSTGRRLRHEAPSGACTIRIGMNLECDAGTDKGAHFDAITLKLGKYS